MDLLLFWKGLMKLNRGNETLQAYQKISFISLRTTVSVSWLASEISFTRRFFAVSSIFFSPNDRSFPSFKTYKSLKTSAIS